MLQSISRVHRVYKKTLQAVSLALVTTGAYAFGDLHLAVENYRIYAEQGGWEQIPEGPLLAEGTCHGNVPVLRQRLAVTGDYRGEAPQEPLCMDGALRAAVERFQERHGMEKVDGKVGPDTREQLNVPAEVKLRKLEHNLAHLPLVPLPVPERHIAVNIAEQHLYVMEHGRPVLDMKVIVGKKKRQTPEFRDEIEYVVLNPYWNIPTVIANVDMLPHIKKDIRYLTKHQIKVYASWEEIELEQEIDPTTIEWDKYSWGGEKLPYVLRQSPGPENFLGVVKFLLPNSYNVYLHDTNSPYLFDRHQRTFSSGCVRVSKPRELAMYLLNRETLEEPENHTYKWIALEEKVPVIITYRTAWVDEAGTVHFRDDFYGREKWDQQKLSCNYGSVDNTCDRIETDVATTE